MDGDLFVRVSNLPTIVLVGGPFFDGETRVSRWTAIRRMF